MEPISIQDRNAAKSARERRMRAELQEFVDSNAPAAVLWQDPGIGLQWAVDRYRVMVIREKLTHKVRVGRWDGKILATRTDKVTYGE